jgi:hypothetical protein
MHLYLWSAALSPIVAHLVGMTGGAERTKTRDLSGLDTAPLEFVRVGQVGHTAGHCGGGAESTRHLVAFPTVN